MFLRIVDNQDRREKYRLNNLRDEGVYSKPIADYLNLQLAEYDIKKINTSLNNSFLIDDRIAFYPPNDGKPTMPIYFYKEGKIIFKNENAFSEITNLDDILLKMVDVFSKSLEKDFILNPYGFMLKLEDEIVADYKGQASLVLTDKSIINRKAKDIKKFYLNRFLDHFIGWNFGVSVNRSPELRKALEKLNDQVIELGLREDAGPGFEVYGSDYDVYNGLQHYTLPKTKDNAPQKTYK